MGKHYRCDWLPGESEGVGDEDRMKEAGKERKKGGEITEE